MNSNVPENDEWITRLQGPDRDAAIAELRGLLVRGLSKSLAQRGGGDAFAQDIAQEALIRILDRLDSFAGRSKFTTWAMTIATRVGISQLRRRHHQDVSLDAMTVDAALRLTDETIGNSAERSEVFKTLRRLISETLTEKQRIAMQALLDGWPVERIAKSTGSNRNAVYKLIHDARQRLRDGLEDAGISVDEMKQVFS